MGRGDCYGRFENRSLLRSSSPFDPSPAFRRGASARCPVAQTSLSAISRVSKPAGPPMARNASRRPTRHSLRRPCRFGNRRYSRFGNLCYGGGVRLRPSRLTHLVPVSPLAPPRPFSSHVIAVRRRLVFPPSLLAASPRASSRPAVGVALDPPGPPRTRCPRVGTAPAHHRRRARNPRPDQRPGTGPRPAPAVPSGSDAAKVEQLPKRTSAAPRGRVKTERDRSPVAAGAGARRRGELPGVCARAELLRAGTARAPGARRERGIYAASAWTVPGSGARAATFER